MTAIGKPSQAKEKIAKKKKIKFKTYLTVERSKVVLRLLLRGSHFFSIIVWKELFVVLMFGLLSERGYRVAKEEL